MNATAQTLLIAIVTVASAAAIGMGLADRTAQSKAETVQLERVVVVGKRAVEAPVEYVSLPRVEVVGHAAQADVRVAGL